MYWTNLKLWAKGIRWLWTRQKTREQLNQALREAVRWGYDRLLTLKVQEETFIVYHTGWGPWTFLPVYLFNIGTHVLFGGSVQTWSRWFWETRHRYRLSAFANRLLNHADENHGAESGTVLWGSREQSWAATGALCFWSLVLGGVLYLAYGYWQGG